MFDTVKESIKALKLQCYNLNEDLIEKDQISDEAAKEVFDHFETARQQVEAKSIELFGKSNQEIDTLEETIEMRPISSLPGGMPRLDQLPNFLISNAMTNKEIEELSRS